MSNLEVAENKLNEAINTLRGQIKKEDPKELSQVIVEEIKEPTEGIEIVLEQKKEPKKEPRHSEFVQTDDPKVLDRIKDLYTQVKKSDARNQMLIDHNRQMEEKFAEYQKKLNDIEQTNKNNAVTKVESELKAQLRIAREENDYDTIDSIEDKLFDLKLEKKSTEKVQNQPEKPKLNPQQQQLEAQYMRNAAYIEILAQEKDSNGTPIRGYLYNDHPDNEKAIHLFESIPKEFASAGRTADIKTIMDVMDQRMMGKKEKSHSSVLSGDGDNVPPKNVVKLNQEEIRVAHLMGLTPERYARQKQLINS